MKRVALVLAFIAIAAFLVIGSLSNTVQAGRPNLDTGGRGQPEQAEQAEQPAAPNVVLIDQYNSPLNNYIVSANRTDNPIASAEAADDFVVPAGETWQINQVDVRAGGGGGFPNPTSFNVFIYTEADTLPGTPVYTATNLAVGGINPNYIITLTTPADLATGTYWVAIQGNIVGANWYWQGRTVLNNNSTAWRENGGYGTGCLNWTRLTTCSGFTWPGQMFRLHGTIGGGGSPTSTIVPSSTSTSTATSTSTSTVTPIPTNTQTSVPTGTTAASVTSVSTSTATSVSTSVATSTATVTPCTITFSDVPTDHTFYANIRCLACRDILGGYPDGTFRPGNLVTRGQLAKIVANAAGFIEPATTQQFEDVPVGSTFHEFIWRLANRGYITGYPCGGPGEPCGGGNLPYFRPNANVTRGQISKIVANAAGFIEPATTQQFEDVPVSSTFHEFIWRLANRAIMSGYPCGGPGEPCGSGNLPYFRPGANATRGQASKIVANTFFPNCETPVGR